MGRPATATRSASSLSWARRMSASASPSASPGFVRRPVFSWMQRSGMPTSSVDTDGSPQAIASISICGRPSTSLSLAQTQWRQ
jgi:hypothetical protein